MSEKLTLLSDSSDSDVEFKVNKSYAYHYDKWRHKEELQKLKDLGSESESSSSESEEAPEIEEEFLKTLSLLKSKDPQIYDQNVSFFKDTNETKSVAKKEKKPKPLFMKEYERKLLLERNGEDSDEDEHIPYSGPSYSEEQNELKESFKAVLNDSSDDEDGDSGLLQVREKSEAEKESEEADYLKWLKGKRSKVSDDTEKDMSFLHKFWNDPKIDEDEKFLKDYILNKRYVEEDKSGEIPTYDDIVNDVTELSDDEKETQQQELFEHKYNFRFEEPDQDFIKRYPRTIGDSLRRTENKRKLQRHDYAERKKKEKEQRKEELKRLKAFKRKEIEEKFEKLKEVSGYDNLDMNEIDIESDFDPEKHDQKMNEIFNDNYYDVEEMTKPEFPYDEELDAENWDQWTGEDEPASRSNSKIDKFKSSMHDVNKSSSDSESEEGERDPKHEFQKEMIQASNTGKKRTKKKSLFAKLLAKPKPVYDPDGKSFQEYLDEYYQLDYEDVISDMPVRFKYRKVVPNNFGLSVDEILKANDKELNRWCSVKKASQYRNEEEEKYDVQAFQKKAQNLNAKKKVFLSLFAEPEEDETIELTSKDSQAERSVDSQEDEMNVSKIRKKKKKSKKGKATEEECRESCEMNENSEVHISNLEVSQADVTDASAAKKRKRKRKSKRTKQPHENIESYEVEQNENNDVCDKYDISLENANVTQHHTLKNDKKALKSKIKSINNHNVEAAIKNNSSYEDESSIEKLNPISVLPDTVPSDIKKGKRHKKTKKLKIDANQDDCDLNELQPNSHVNVKLKDVFNPDCSGIDLPDKAVSNSKHISSKKRKKKKKSKLKADSDETLNSQKTKKQFNKNSSKKDNQKDQGLSDARLKAYGINPKKFHRTKIYGKTAAKS